MEKHSHASSRMTQCGCVSPGNSAVAKYVAVKRCLDHLMLSCEGVEDGAAMTFLHLPLSSHGYKEESYQESNS